MRNYRNIKAFQLADQLCVAIYKITKKFPKEERYGLISQIRRAAVSIPTNIAEGTGRKYGKVYINFLYVAIGSMSEVEYLLNLSFSLGYLDNAYYLVLEKKRKEAARVLMGLIKSVEKAVDSGLWNK